MTASTLEVGITLPQLTGPSYDHAGLRRYLGRVEALGFRSGWVAEMHGAPQLDPLVTLAFAAAVTTRLRLGVAVLLAALRAPLQLARDVASIDQLSGGRIDLGVGLGADRALPPRYAVPTAGRVSRYDAGIDLLARLFTEDTVTTGSDSPWRLDSIRLQPRPVQRPHPPLWFGARSPSGIARAVRRGDGWIGAATWPLADLPADVQSVRTELDRVGRDPATFRIARKIAVLVDDDPVRAARRALEHWTGLGRPHLAEPTTVTGTPAQVADRIAALAGLGLDLIVLDPVTDHADQAERLASDVLPHLLAAAAPPEPAAPQGDPR